MAHVAPPPHLVVGIPGLRDAGLERASYRHRSVDLEGSQMAGNMPFIVARGNTFFTAIERTDAATRVTALTRLLAGRTDSKPLWDAPAVNLFPAQQKAHLRDHWFGNPPVVAGQPVGLPAVDPAHPTTGWWANWFGDAHEIVRQTMQRAYQIALGSASDTTVTPTRNWAITVYWVCGAAYFHGAVGWDEHVDALGVATGDGHVSVFFCTPMVDESYTDPNNPVPYIEMLAGVMGPETFSFGLGDHAFAVIGHESSVKVVLKRVGGKRVYVSTPDETYEQLGDSETVNRIKEMEANSEKWGSAVPAGTPSAPAFVRVSLGAVITVRQ